MALDSVPDAIAKLMAVDSTNAVLIVSPCRYRQLGRRGRLPPKRLSQDRPLGQNPPSVSA
jgi:hypothetical protein